MKENTASSHTSLPLALSAKGRRTGEQPVAALMAAPVGRPGLINFAAGFVDSSTLPVEECAEISRRLFADPAHGRRVLQYDATVGLKDLRMQAVGHIERLEGRPAASFSVGPEDIIITTGSQQTLYLVADVLLDPGDIVITSNPSYFVFTGTLQSLGAQVLGVPVDDDGMDVEKVAQLLEHLAGQGRLGRVKFIYCTSFYENPTGLTLSRDRRQKLLDIVRSFSRGQRVLIIEDGAYRELGYEQDEPLPSIKSLDPENRFTVLTQTFSKAFAPGLKLGYTAMPPDLHRAVLRQKGNHDFGSASLCQHFACEALRDGSYYRHIEIVRDEYRRKRDTMLAALDKHMPKAPGLSWLRPRGGLYVWVTLPENIDTGPNGQMLQACLGRGVLYVPGAYCFHPDENGAVPSNHMRLSYGQVERGRIEEGIARLAAVVGAIIEGEGAGGGGGGA